MNHPYYIFLISCINVACNYNLINKLLQYIERLGLRFKDKEGERQKEQRRVQKFLHITFNRFKT